ncbi:MAG: flagellar hook-length control protein FliK [Ignavibacteria bacterium]|jgi:hypothetical protein|nr:flagellar hook-length control protein FliK [Ignavibacteria bacterium]
MNTFSSLVSNTNLLSRLFNNLENNPAKNLQINNCIKLSANILQNQKALSNPIKFNALGTKIFPEIIENNTINNNIFPINIPDLENTNIDVASIFDNILSNISIENKSIANMPKVPVNDNITNDLSMASIPVKKINVEKKLGIAKNKIKEIINAISLENPIGFIAKNAEKINIIIDDNIPKITSENIANILNNIDEIILPTFEPQIIENKSIKENIIAKKINKIKNINKYDTPIIHILQPIAIPQHIAMADKISLMENNNIADNNINFEPIIQTNKQINSEIKLDNKIEKYISLKNKIDTDINLENHSENIAESIYKNKPKNVIKNIVQKESQAIEIKDVTNLENKKYPKIISPINSNNETLKDADIDKFVKYIARKINTQDINLTSPRNINIQAIKSTHIIEKNNIIDIPQDNNIEKLNIFINQLDMNISIDINNNNEHYIIAKDFIAKIPVFINTYDEININIVDVNSINKKEKKYPPQNIPLILNNNQNNIKDLTGIPAKIEINIHSNPLKNQIISPKKIKDKQWNPPNIINEISQIKNTEIDEDLDIVPFKYENFTPNFVVHSKTDNILKKELVIKDMPVDVKTKPVVMREIKEVVEKDTLIADIPVDVKAEPVVIPEIKEVVENDTVIADIPVDVKTKPVVMSEIKEVVEKDTLIADIPVDVKEKPVVMSGIKEVIENKVVIKDMPVDVKAKPVVIPEIKEVVEKDTLIADILVDVKEKPVEVKLKPVVPLEIKEVIENKPVIINEVVNDNIHIVNNNTQFAKNNDQKEDRQDDKNEEYSPKKVETNHNPANFAINNPTPSVVPQTVVQKPISQVFNSVRPNELPKIVTNFAGKIPFQSSGIAKIILNPEQLGTLFVEVNLMGEKPIITFKANNQVAVEVLTNNIENLKEMLGGAQIREPEFKFERFIVENGKLSSENKIENNSNSPEQNNFNKQNENGNHSQQQHQRNDNSRDNGQNGRNNFSNYFDIENGINVADEAVEIPKSEVRYRNNNSLVEEYI